MTWLPFLRLTRTVVYLWVCGWASAMAAPFGLVTWTPPGDGTVRNFRGGLEIVDLATGQRNGSPILIPGGARQVAAARLSDRAYVATRTGLFETGIAIVSLSAGAVVAHWRLRTTGEFIKAIALSGDERQLYVLHPREDEVTVIDTASGQVVKQLAVSGSIDRLAPSADGRRLYAPTGIYIRAWDTTTWTETLIPYAGGATIIVASPDGERLYVGNADDSVSVLELATLRITSTQRLPGTPAVIALSGNGRALFVGYAGGNLVSRIDTASLSMTSFDAPVKPKLLAASPDGTKLMVSEAIARAVWILDGSTGAVAQVIDGVWYPNDIAPSMPAAARGAAFGELVVEFYNAALDHYFVTAQGNEIADLDSGVHRGWKRTGESFLAFRSGSSNGVGSPVCRFYGLPQFRLDSHFYSASPSECAEVRTRFGGAWLEETSNAFEIALPDLASGACPAGTDPVYRLWNNRTDSNHRYTVRFAYEVEARGWIREGYGKDGVAMCALR